MLPSVRNANNRMTRFDFIFARVYNYKIYSFKAWNPMFWTFMNQNQDGGLGVG